MFRKLEEDLKNWVRCDLSWLGRINAVKMTLMPWILYLFRSLPISIPKKDIAKFQSKIIDFVWGSKGHRLSRDILYRSKNQGGLGLPNVWLY